MAEQQGCCPNPADHLRGIGVGERRQPRRVVAQDLGSNAAEAEETSGPNTGSCTTPMMVSTPPASIG